MPRQQQANRNWTLIFLVSVLVFDVGLFLFGDTPIRLPLRIGGFAVSLGFLFLVPRQKNTNGDSIPAARWFWIAIGLLAVGLINPEGDTILARLAIDFLYISVLAPIVWIGRLSIDRNAFRRVIIVLWGFYTLSAAAGVLQVEYPNQFGGAISENYDEASMRRNSFTLDSGDQIVRPTGLSDSPGGAATAGVSSIVLGTGLLLTERKLRWRIMTIGGMVAGLFCIYICQGRSDLVIIAVSELTMLAVLIRRRILGRAMLLLAVVSSVAALGTAFAFSVGGQVIVDRWLTLIAENPSTVFQRNRGQFLDQLLTVDMWKYPLGAGQGRWGMMSTYFGTRQHELWAEMQWQALLYDGGIPLILAYIALLGALLWAAFKICNTAISDDLACWAAVVLGYTFAAVIATFSFPFLCHDIGMHLMLLNACLYGVYLHERIRSTVLPPRKRISGSSFPANIPSLGTASIKPSSAMNT